VDRQQEGGEGADQVPAPPQRQPPAPPGAIVTVQQTVQGFTGPIPPPEVLGGYEAVLPGTANRIVSMAERQSEHRQDLERRVVGANIRHEELGPWIGAAVVVILIAAAVIVTIAGYPWTGGVIGAFDVVGVVTVFVLRQQARERDLQDKAKQT
jgi:uncharacterized membrane protein